MKRNNSLMNLNVKGKEYDNDNTERLEMERIEKEQQELDQLRERYNRHVFNKKMSEYYLDLNKSQKECDESIKYLNNKRELIKPKVLSRSSLPFHNITSKLIMTNKLNRNTNNNSTRSLYNKSNTNINTKNFFKRTTGQLLNKSNNNNNSLITTKITLNQTMNKSKLQRSSSYNFFSKLQPEGNIKQNRNNSYKDNNNDYNNDNTISLPRRKKYKIAYDINWSKRQGFIEQKETLKATYTNHFYQKQLITSELLVINDNITKFQMSYVDILLSIAPHINEIHIKVINIILESTCGLIIEIAHLFLSDFIKYASLVGKNAPSFPSFQRDNEEVFDEVEELSLNVKEFNQLTDFLKENNELYQLITAQLKNIVLSLPNMIKIKQYLARCRYNISKLIFTSKSYIDKFNFDEEVYGKYKLKISKIDNDKNKDNEEIVSQRKEVQRINIQKREGLMKKENCEAERVRRLTVLLNSESAMKDKEFQIKKRECAMKKEKHIDLESKMMNKLYQYMSIEKKNQIMGEKLIQSFKISKEKSLLNKYK